jgi:hypothetical protein
MPTIDVWDRAAVPVQRRVRLLGGLYERVDTAGRKTPPPTDHIPEDESPKVLVSTPSLRSRDDFASIDRLTIHGEALIIKLALTEQQCEGREELINGLYDAGRHHLVRIIRDEFGHRYELDFASVFDGQLHLYVTTYPPKVNVSFLNQNVNSGESCELWVLAADRATEKARRWLKEELRQHNGEKELLVHAEWVPGKGVDVAGGLDSELTDPGLRARLRSLRRQQRFLRGRLQLAVIGALGLFLLASALAVVAVVSNDGSYWFPAIYIALFASLAAFTALRVVTVVREVRREAAAVEETLDLSGLLGEDEKRAHKLFQINSAEVRRYYDQALRQRKYIFYLGVLCILLGFGSVFIAFSLIWRNPEIPVQEKVVIAILGTVSGILANFVALIFLNMFSAIVKSMVNFHQRLVSTHHVVFSNVLVAKIEDPVLRDSTLAHVATALSQVTVKEEELESGKTEGELAKNNGKNRAP